ncbi:MAG: hypothetical protein K9L68_01805 [Spirochaetales bacterium]|nr:hypothetical protein [Spirochaetales bacterium]MCF7937312.1 hypothetical protein [Spirochaetales bacterium]
MNLTLIKIQGPGRHDFLILDDSYRGNFKTGEGLPELSRVVCKRRAGIGADGLVLLSWEEQEELFRLQLFRSTGKESSRVEDALFCAGRYLFDSGRTGREMNILTPRETAELEVINSETLRLYLSRPEDESGPLKEDPDRSFLRSLGSEEGEATYIPVRINERNHLVRFTRSNERKEIKAFTRAAASEGLRGDVVSVIVANREKLILPAVPRREGVQYSLQSAAAQVASVLQGFCDRTVLVRAGKHTCISEWDEEDDRITITGKAGYRFSAEYYYEPG